MKITFQGEPGAFSEAAARTLFPDGHPAGLRTFRQVFESVASGEAARGVVPVENTVAGAVPEVMDLLAEFAERELLTVHAEHWLRVEQALLALPGTALGDIAEVRSHPQALTQAAAFLDERAPAASRVPAADTAGAAREIAQSKLEGVAAVASRTAAELYGLEVVAENVETDRRNYTRFFALARRGTKPGRADRATLVLTPSLQAPNALFRALTAFVGRRLALHRIDARPRLGRPGEYHYFADVERDASGADLKAAIADAGPFCDRLLVVGEYAADKPG
jgi:prephenate dehydratase